MHGLDLLVRRLEARDALSSVERDDLCEAAGPTERHASHTVVVRENAPQTQSRLLIKGFVARAKILADGARQITGLHIPGDFVDLHSFPLKRLDHDVQALSDIELLVFPHEALRRITETQPHLTRLLWMSTLIDAATHREWIANAGRKTAVQQIASLFCEVFMRHQIVGLTDRNSAPLPMTQIDLADACGLSPVHVNRVVQELREAGLIEWRARRLTIPDYAALAAFAQFDPAFLILNREPR